MAKKQITSEEIFDELYNDALEYARLKESGRQARMLELAERYSEISGWTDLGDRFKSEKAKQSYWETARVQMSIYSRLKHEGIYYFVGRAVIETIRGMLVAMEEGKTYDEIREMAMKAIQPIWGIDPDAGFPVGNFIAIYGLETRVEKEDLDNAGV